MTTWLITGCSTGLGRSFAEAVLDRGHNVVVTGKQPGDPAKAATVLIQAVESDSPPYMLLLGNDTSDGFRAVLDALRADADAWEDLSRSTDFDA